MTRDELIAAISDFTGLRVTDSDTKKGREYLLLSPNGKTICTISISGSDEKGWQFGGIGGGFPDDWRALCRIHESAG